MISPKMKRISMNRILTYLFILLNLIVGHNIYCQAKYDYNWVLGYLPNKPEKYFGGVNINFHNANRLNFEYFHTKIDAHQPTFLSNSSGELLLYSNGCSILNAHHDTLINGEKIAAGVFWDDYCARGGPGSSGYPGTQNRIMLPWPGDTSRAIIVYFKILDNFSSYHLQYSVIQINNNSTESQVIEKDQFLADVGTTALITAVQHANGKDWWIMVPEDASNRFFTYLIDNKGIKLESIQACGAPWDGKEWASQAVFSPDGATYVRFNPWKGLDIFSFDRCTGILSNPKELGPMSLPEKIGGGAAFSANSRFLYVSNVDSIYQFDMLESDILSSKVVIATYDGFLDPFPTTYYHLILAPDNRIYVFSTSGKKSLDVIMEPEKKGASCDFRGHSVHLPAYIYNGGINIPYFRLGPLDNSSCDTIGLNNLATSRWRWEVNDSGDPLTIKFTDLSFFEPETWEWKFDDGTETETQSPIHTFPDYGLYHVCQTVENEFQKDSSCQWVELLPMTSINPISNNKYSIQPNPFKESIQINKRGSGYSYGEITIGNIHGQIVFKTGNIIIPETLNISHLTSGIYFCIIQEAQGEATILKIVKQ